MDYGSMLRFRDYVNEDIKRKNNLMDKQQKYNYFLKESSYNRRVKDFKTGEYKEAGRKIMYLLNSSTGEKKNLMGYNFNHTICPSYLNYNNKLNIEKVKKIIEMYQTEYIKKGEAFFVTYTMPNLVADYTNIEAANKVVKKANQVVTNMYKQVEKKFGVTGQIKKYEVTYSYSNGQLMMHPHFHLLMHFEDVYNVTVLKGKESAREFIFEYWYKHFLKKYLSNEIEVSAQKSLDLNLSSKAAKGINIDKLTDKTQKELKEQVDSISKYVLKKLSDAAQEEIIRKVCYGAFDMQRAKYSNLKHEIAGYIGANSYDYLMSQETFDFAYQHMHNKRILTYQGIFKEINKKLKLDKIEELEELEDDAVEYDTVVSFLYSRKHKSYYISRVNMNLGNFDERLIMEFTDLKETGKDLNERMRSSGLDKSTSSSKTQKTLLLEKFFKESFPTWEMLENNQQELDRLEKYKNQGYIEQLEISLD